MTELLSKEKIICFGESYWITASERDSCFPLSITYHLKALGLSPLLITRVGLDDAGKQLIRDFEGKQIATDYFQIDYDYNTAKWNGFSESLKAWNNIEWDDRFTDIITNDTIFIHSLLPASNQRSRDTLFKVIDRLPKRVFQLQHFEPFVTQQIVGQCLQGAYVLHLSVPELEWITGWFSRSTSIEDRISVLQDRFYIPYLLVHNKENEVIVKAKDSLYTIKQPDGSAGKSYIQDAFLAGFLFQLITNRGIPAVLDFANALITNFPVNVFEQYNADAIYETIKTNNKK
ncbi:carbohydrate kinase family protein [Agriterribacter sp.]|uniref:carbohydrate kinase family protein n=1 Tax=Agriterribacter sp. TaxID=2821509 RepID=UPI002C6425C1|nr:carbohydrate kinase family protein [Agriterribacter sp.]HRO45868.1 carbohydrate kinase family protein [Agriterribacter sp.]HRQ18943.1 carbohydrate kinase family protein [Agriterribacter sp.]